MRENDRKAEGTDAIWAEGLQIRPPMGAGNPELPSTNQEGPDEGPYPTDLSALKAS